MKQVRANILLTILICALGAQSIHATEASGGDSLMRHCMTDTLPDKESAYCFKPAQLIVPGALLAVGTFGVYNSEFKRWNNKVKNIFDRIRKHHCRADEYLRFVPVIFYAGADFCGIKAAHPFKERLAAGATAYLAMGAMTEILKYSIREPRPDSDERNSFPSGHTATAFTGAELVRLEYGNWIGAGAYAVAATVGFLRIYNGRHWCNDVLAGAGIGILSARIGYWMLPLYRKWFKWSDTGRNSIMAVAPAYNYASRSFSLNLAYTF